MQVTFIGVVVCLVLSVGLHTQAQEEGLRGQPGLRGEPGPRGGPGPRGEERPRGVTRGPSIRTITWAEGALTPDDDEKQQLEQLAKNLTVEEDTELMGRGERGPAGRPVPGIRPGQCLPQKRSTLIYRYLKINGRKQRCHARVSLTNCLGYCRSYQSVSPYNGYVSKYCACCQAVRHQTVTQYVTLYCPNVCNYVRYRHTSIQPAQCRCRSC